MDWQKISTLDRRWLYLCLFIVVAWQTMFPLKVQNVVSPMSAGLFDYLNSLNEGDFIVIQSDWTMSTQGESQGKSTWNCFAINFRFSKRTLTLLLLCFQMD